MIDGTVKPEWGAVLDADSEFGSVLMDGWLFNEGSGGLLTGLRDSLVTWSAQPTWGPNISGMGITCGSNYGTAPDSPQLDPASGDFTIVIGHTGGSSGTFIDKRVNSGAFVGFVVYISTTSLGLQLTGGGNGSNEGYNVATWPSFSGTNQIVVSVSRASQTANSYYNGTLFNSQSIAATSGALTAAQSLFIGNNIQANSAFNGVLNYVYLFRSALSADQVSRLYEQPYQMVRDSGPRFRFPWTSLVSVIFTATRYPTTASTTAGTGTANWSNPTFAELPDGNCATVTLTSNLVSYELIVNGYGFSNVMPTTATPIGIQVGFLRDQSVISSIHDRTVQLYLSGSLVGSNKSAAAAWPTSFTTAQFGSSSDNWGWGSFTATNVTDSTFGVALQAVNGNGAAIGTASVDAVPMTAWWTGSAYVSATWPMYLDELATVAKTAKIPEESLATVQQTVKLLVDTAGSIVARTTPMLIDALATAVKTVKLPVETLRSTTGAVYVVPIESLLSVELAWKALVDILITAENAQPMLLDTLGPHIAGCPMGVDILATVLRTSSDPIEALHTLAAAETLPAEALRQVAETCGIPHESLGTGASTANIPAEWGGTHQVSGFSGFPIESLGSVVSKTMLCVEALSTLSGGSITPVEWLHTLRANEIIPVDWGALPNPDEIWIANPRGTIWIASARGTVWEANSRDTNWNPQKG